MQTREKTEGHPSMRSIIFFITVITICMIPVRYCLAETPWQEHSQRFCDEYKINYQEAKNLTNQLNELAKADDKQSIAKMIHYPVEIIKRKKSGEAIHSYINNEKEFLKQYPLLFNEHAKKDLEFDHNALCHSLGMVGTAGGEIWFNEGLKIISIATIRY